VGEIAADGGKASLRLSTSKIETLNNGVERSAREQKCIAGVVGGVGV